jgi:hypothetical protein
MTRIDLIVFEGAEELDVFGPLEPFTAPYAIAARSSSSDTVAKLVA